MQLSGRFVAHQGGYFYCYGLFGFLDEWINRGFYETPEQITELFRKMMQRKETL